MPRTCKICKKKFEPKYSTTQMVCSYQCSIEHTRAQSNKAWRQRKVKMKDDLMTLKDWLKIAQITFNKYIRERDKNEGCISCGSKEKTQYDAGHYRSVGAHPQLRFEEINVHKQCRKCNSFFGGNLIEYRKNLVNKIGIEKVEWLEKEQPIRKYTIPEVQDLIKEYKEKIKLL